MPSNGQESIVAQYSTSDVTSDDLHKVAQIVPTPTGRLFHSGSRYLVRWKALLLLLVAYDAFILPFEWVFIKLKKLTPCAMYINLFIDLMFFIDIVVHFNTARMINGSWVTNRKELAIRYIRTWFIVDAASAVPFDLIFNLRFRWFKFVRIFGLLRVVKFSKMAHTIRTNFKLSASVYRVIRFVVMVVFGIHWCACVFWVLNKSHVETDPTSLTEPVRHFVDSLFWSTSTIIPIGYGDVRAMSGNARLFAVAVMAFGVVLFTFAITRGVGLVQELSDIERRRFESKMDHVEEVLDHVKIPDDLWDIITYFFEYNHEARIPTMCNEMSIIENLSRQLRSEVIGVVKDYQTDDLFVLDCVFAMQTKCFPPNDDLSMLMNGYLCCVVEGSLIFEDRIIGPGARFGSLSSSRQGKDLKGPISRTWCRISVLDRDTLIPILIKHRQVQRNLCGKEGLRLRPTINHPGREGWVSEIVDHLSREQCQALSLMVDGLLTRLQHQEKLIKGVDRIFADDIARRPSCRPGSPSTRAIAFTLDAFSTPSVKPESPPLISSDLETFQLDGIPSTSDEN